MSDFERALEFTLPWETGGDPDGGYTNDPLDPGGETKWGISKRSYPDLDIGSLARGAAKEIYERDYWRGEGDSGQQSFCAALLWPLCAAHFDCVVNVGNRKIARDGTIVWHRRANMILQRALAQTFDRVDDDGYIGPITLGAIHLCDPRKTAARVIMQRDLYYVTLGRLYERYGRGWHRRTNALRKLIGTEGHFDFVADGKKPAA